MIMGKATKWRQLSQPISSENLQLSQRNYGPEQAPIARDRYNIIASKNKRLPIKENLFLDLFTMVFEEFNLKEVA